METNTNPTRLTMSDWGDSINMLTIAFDLTAVQSAGNTLAAEAIRDAALTRLGLAPEDFAAVSLLDLIDRVAVERDAAYERQG